MKKYIYYALFFGFGLYVSHHYKVLFEPLELEIYTSKNIYYINGLQVTNERDTSIMYFSSKQSLKLFISYITAEENQ